MKKLFCRRGESLVESLVSILIVAISAALLATMITASVNINRKANMASEELRMKMSNAEKRESASSQSGIITIIETSTLPVYQAQVDVNITSGPNTLRAYWRAGHD